MLLLYRGIQLAIFGFMLTVPMTFYATSPLTTLVLYLVSAWGIVHAGALKRERKATRGVNRHVRASNHTEAAKRGLA